MRKKVLFGLIIFLFLLPSSQSQVIQMKKKGKSFELPCKINGLDLTFTLDTGADDLSISLPEALFMLKNNYLSKNDILGTAYYKLASGNLVEGTKIIIRKLEIGGLTIKNIEASIIHSATAQLLFGQSALERLGLITIDYVKQILIIGKRQEVYATPKDSWIDYFVNGNTKCDIGDFVGAIADLSKSIELNPQNELAYYRRGIAKSLLEDFRGAIIDFNKSIELDPQNDAGYYNRGIIKDNLKDYIGAIADFTKTIELNPQHDSAYNNRGFVKDELKNYSEAIQDYNKAIELNPKNFSAYRNRGIDKFTLGDKDGGCLDLSKAGELGDSESYEIIKKYCK